MKNFREEAADKGLKNWAHEDPSIHTQCFTDMMISQKAWYKICMPIN